MYKYDFPDGWTCIDCGDEYIEDIYGKFISDYKEGTLCSKCFNSEKEIEEVQNEIQGL